VILNNASCVCFVLSVKFVLSVERTGSCLSILRPTWFAVASGPQVTIIVHPWSSVGTGCNTSGRPVLIIVIYWAKTAIRTQNHQLDASKELSLGWILSHFPLTCIFYNWRFVSHATHRRWTWPACPVAEAQDCKHTGLMWSTHHVLHLVSEAGIAQSV
jgi:hypothetical protein